MNQGKYDRHPYKLKLAETPIPKNPHDIVHMDVFISGQLYFSSFVDKLSKFAIKTRSILDVRRGLTKFISTYGTPKLVVCDNEPSLKSVEIVEFTKSGYVKFISLQSTKAKLMA
jgi:hypothetical protein